MRLIIALLLLLMSVDAYGVVSRPPKTFGGTSYIDGVIPRASDFNGDIDTIYNAHNNLILNPSFDNTLSVRGVEPCFKLDESDQGVDLRKWFLCSSASQFQITTRRDDDTLLLTALSLNRSTGRLTLPEGITLNGSLSWSTDNSYDIGGSASGRPRDVFIGRHLSVAGNVTSSLKFSPDNTLDIGQVSGLRPRNVYIGGQLRVNDSIYFESPTAKITRYAGAPPSDGQLLIGHSSNGVFEASTLTAGRDIQVTNGPGSVTLASLAVPAGVVMAWVLPNPPSGWLLCDGSTYVANDYSNTSNTGLFDVLVQAASSWGYPTPTTTISGADPGTDIITTSSNHGRSVNDVIHFSGTLPGGLSPSTKYYVKSVPSATTLTVSLTLGGPTVDITSNVSGGSLYHQFKVPDARDRNLMGRGSTYGLGVSGGSATHTLTVNEMPSHNHGVNDPGHAHFFTVYVPGGAGVARAGDAGGPLGTGYTWSSTTGISIQSTGGGQPHNILDPFVTMTFIIKT